MNIKIGVAYPAVQSIMTWALKNKFLQLESERGDRIGERRDEAKGGGGPEKFKEWEQLDPSLMALKMEEERNA